MTTRGSKVTAIGLALTMIAVGAGVSSTGGFALLLSFAGVLAGASLIFVGVRVAEDPTAAIGRPRVLSPGLRALVHCVHRYLALAGLLLASVAVSATADREASPVLCFCAFVLFLLSLSLLNVGVRVVLVEQEQ